MLCRQPTLCRFIDAPFTAFLDQVRTLAAFSKLQAAVLSPLCKFDQLKLCRISYTDDSFDKKWPSAFLQLNVYQQFIR